MNKITDAHIVLTGKVNGFDVTVEGDVKDVVIDKDPPASIEDYGSTRLFKPQQYVLKFKPQDDGVQFTSKIAPKVVKHRVTLETDGEIHPAMNLSVYKQRAAVPENASWRYTSSTKTIVFEWEEEVYR